MQKHKHTHKSIDKINRANLINISSETITNNIALLEHQISDTGFDEHQIIRVINPKLRLVCLFSNYTQHYIV